MTPIVVQIDLAAIAGNLDALSRCAPQAEVMAVVKADAYGHGALPVARTARAWGAAWLGVAHPSEALNLRRGGDAGRILAWLWVPGTADVAAAVAADVDLSIGSLAHLDDVVAAAAGHRPRVHLKVDTGLSRNGCLPGDWAALVEAARRAPIDVVGVWSHLANADAEDPAVTSVDAQLAVLHRAVDEAWALGLAPQIVHCANTAGVIAHPAAHLDLVRVGIGMYGLSAGVSALGPPLRPAMRMTSRIALVKTLPAGAGVGYGSTWIAERATRVGLVPVGYADGLPRGASGRARVRVSDTLVPIIGRIAMDQCVIDISDVPAARVGSDVVIFGRPDLGEPSADDLAAAADTIGYEVLTRVGSRAERRVLGHDRAIGQNA